MRIRAPLFFRLASIPSPVYPVCADYRRGVSGMTRKKTFDSESVGSIRSPIRKRTPLEQAIAVQSDRRARYEAKMRARGFRRTTVWLRVEDLDAFQEVVRIKNGGEGDLAAACARLLGTARNDG
jgi:hypothetical protein